MKYNKILFSIPLVLMTACNGFLDKMPDDRAVIDTPEKIGELLTYAYPEQNCDMFCYGMSDNATEKEGSTNTSTILEDAYNWNEPRLSSQDTPEIYWYSCYSAIKQVNHALEAIEERVVNGEIPEDVKAYYGEALVARAYNHFMLATLWSKSYNPETANKDLGIPYVTKPEKVVRVNYERGTVAQVYEMIGKDLEEGLKYIDDQVYENKFLHWNKAAAYTFAARYYSVIGDFDKVLKYTNLVLSSSPADQLRDLTGKYSTMDISEAILEWSRTTEQANLLVVPQYSLWFVYYFGAYKHGMSIEMYRFLFRKSFVGGEWIWNLYGQDPNIFFIKWGYHLEKSGINSGIGYYMIMNPLVQIEEALFLRMEANVMLEKYDDVTPDMNAYLSKRLKSYSPLTHAFSYEKMQAEYREKNYNYNLSPFYPLNEKQRVYMNCLYDLRRKEFYYTNMRWFDHKRFNTRVLHYFLGKKEPVYLEPGDPRRELQIPASAQDQGVVPNPR